MSEQEKYEPWEPLDGTHTRVEVLSLQDADDGLIVRVNDMDSSRILRFSFGGVVAYRCMDESYRHRTWRNTAAQARSGLLTVQGSQWVEWLCWESDGLLDAGDLTHYAIFTHDDCIDVVARHAPEVTVML